IATMGRLTKKRDTSASCLRCLTGGDRDGHAVSYLQQPLDDDVFAGFHTVGHDPQVADAVPHRHRTNRHLVVAAHDGYLIAALQLGDGALRNQQGSRGCAYREADASVSARAKKRVGIWKDAGDPNRPCRLIDFAIGEGDPSDVFVNGAIPEEQLKRHASSLLL